MFEIYSISNLKLNIACFQLFFKHTLYIINVFAMLMEYSLYYMSKSSSIGIVRFKLNFIHHHYIIST